MQKKEDKYLYIYHLHQKKQDANIKESTEKQQKAENYTKIPQEGENKQQTNLQISSDKTSKKDSAINFNEHLSKEEETLKVSSDFINKDETDINPSSEKISKQELDISSSASYIWKSSSSIKMSSEGVKKDKLDIESFREKLNKQNVDIKSPQQSLNKESENISVHADLSKTEQQIKETSKESKENEFVDVPSKSISKDATDIVITASKSDKVDAAIDTPQVFLNKNRVDLTEVNTTEYKENISLATPPHNYKEASFLAETHWQHKTEEDINVPFNHKNKQQKLEQLGEHLEKSDKSIEEVIEKTFKQENDIPDNVSETLKQNKAIDEPSPAKQKQSDEIGKFMEHLTKEVQEIAGNNIDVSKIIQNLDIEEIIQNIKSSEGHKIIDIQQLAQEKVQEIFGTLPNYPSNNMMDVKVKEEYANIIQNITSLIAREISKRKFQEPFDRSGLTNTISDMIANGADVKSKAEDIDIISTSDIKNGAEETINSLQDIQLETQHSAFLDDSKNLNVYSKGLQKQAPIALDFESSSIRGPIYQDETQYTTLLELETNKLVSTNNNGTKSLLQNSIDRPKTSYEKVEKSNILFQSGEQIDLETSFTQSNMLARRLYTDVETPADYNSNMFKSTDKKVLVVGDYETNDYTTYIDNKKNIVNDSREINVKVFNSTTNDLGALITHKTDYPSYKKQNPYKAAGYDEETQTIINEPTLVAPDGDFSKYIESTETIKKTTITTDKNGNEVINHSLNADPYTSNHAFIYYDKPPIDIKGNVTASTNDYSTYIALSDNIKGDHEINTAPMTSEEFPKKSYKKYDKQALFVAKTSDGDVFTKSSSAGNVGSTDDYSTYVANSKKNINKKTSKDTPGYNKELRIDEALGRRSNYAPLSYGIEKNKVANIILSKLQITPKKEPVGFSAPGTQLKIGVPELMTNIIGNYYTYFFEKNIQNRSTLTPTPKSPNELISNKLGLGAKGRLRVIPKTASEGEFDTPHGTKIDMSKVRTVVLKSPATGKPLKGYGYLEIFQTGNSSVNISGSSDKSIYKTGDKKDSPSIPAKIPFEFAPEISSDSRSANFSALNILGRSSSLYAYTGSTNRQLSMSLKYLAVFANERSYTADEKKFLSNSLVVQGIYNKEGKKKSYLNDALEYAKAHKNTQGMEELEGWDEDSVYWVVSALRALILPQYKNTTTPPPVVRLHYGDYYKKKLTYRDQNGHTHVKEVYPLFLVTSRNIEFSGFINPETKRHQAVTVNLTLVEIDEDIYTYQTFYDTAAFTPYGETKTIEKPFNLFKTIGENVIGTLIKNVRIKL